MPSSTAANTSNFLNSIGIVGAANSTVASQLSYLGIQHLRTPDVLSSANLLAAGDQGAKVDAIFPCYMKALTSADVTGFLNTINAAASVIEAVEGPNEVQNDTDTYQGLSGPAAMEAIQQALYTQLQQDSVLTNSTRTTTVYDFSVLQGTADGT